MVVVRELRMLLAVRVGLRYDRWSRHWAKISRDVRYTTRHDHGIRTVLSRFKLSLVTEDSSVFILANILCTLRHPVESLMSLKAVS